MILADVKITGVKHELGEIYLLRFSEPDETFKEETYVPVYGKAEVERRLYFRNWKYITEQLTSWLNQRLHALWEERKIRNATAIRHDITKNVSVANSLHSLCRYVRKNEHIIKELAPDEKSRCYNNYKKTIIPILAFCAGKEIGG